MSIVMLKFIVLCNSRLALPAISFLNATKTLSAIACCTRDLEFENELQIVTNHLGIKLVKMQPDSWVSKLKELLEEIKPDAVLVKTFAFKIPSQFLNVPLFGFINFHYALLPQYRGSSPLFYILKTRQEYGGVTVHHMTEEWDKGAIILQQYVEIESPETFGKHTQKLAAEGARLTMQLLELLQGENPSLPSIPQNESIAKYIAKPRQEDMLINWNAMSAEEIVALILASNYWSKGAVTTCGKFGFNLLYARLLKEKHIDKNPGTIIYMNEGESVKVACNNSDVIAIDTVFTSYGYLPAFELKQFGIKVNDILGL